MNQELIKELFEYQDGKLYWKKDVNSRARQGDEAGRIKENGYRQTRYENKSYYVHRLIFCMIKGYFPKYVDHINNDRLDNHIENLRECTHSENHGNRKPRDKYRGVSFKKKYNNFLVRIECQGKTYCLGTYSTAEEAAIVYNKKALELFGEFASLNKLKVTE